MKKISVKDRLPRDKQYVLVHLTLNNWGDSDDPEGDRYYTVVKFVKGLSEEDRKKLPHDDPNKYLFKGADVFGNNQVPYYWREFGPGSYFGQEVDFWFELPKSDEQGLVFTGCFEGKEIYATSEVKDVIDHLQGEIKYLRGRS